MTRSLVVCILGLLAIFPPENNGRALAACALLGALLVLVTWRDPKPAAGQAALLVLLALAWPVSLAATAPGAAVEPLVILFLAGVLGLHATAPNRPAAGVLAAAGVVVSLHALAQSFGGLDALARWVEGAAAVPDRDLVLARLREGRAFGTFATPAALGGYLAMALPATLGLAAGRRGRIRVLLGVAALLEAAGLAATLSLTAIAALAGAGVLFGVARPGSRRAVGAGLVVVAMLLAGVVVARREAILDLSRWDSPWRLRAGNFRIALEMIRDHPWLGVGPGGYGEAYGRYRGPGDNEARHVHDLPLELGAEGGVAFGLLGGALFLGLFLGPVLRLGRDAKPWHQGTAVGLAAFALHNLADFTAFFPSILWSAALLRGTLARPPSSEAHPGRQGWRLAGAAVLVGTLGAAVASGGIGLASDARYRCRQAAAEGDLGTTVRLAERACALAPWNPDSRSLLAQALLERAVGRGAGAEDPELRRALDQADRAVASSPVRASAREVRARIRLALGDTPGGFADLVEAARLYPMQDRYARLRDEVAPHLPRRQRPEDRP